MQLRSIQIHKLMSPQQHVHSSCWIFTKPQQHNSPLTPSQGARHVQCFDYLLVSRITHCYRAIKTHSVPCDVLRTVWFSQALGSFCLYPATLAFNKTFACPGHILFLLIGQLGWMTTPAAPTPHPCLFTFLFFWLLVLIRSSIFVGVSESSRPHPLPAILLKC